MFQGSLLMVVNCMNLAIQFSASNTPFVNWFICLNRLRESECKKKGIDVTI